MCGCGKVRKLLDKYDTRCQVEKMVNVNYKELFKDGHFMYEKCHDANMAQTFLSMIATIVMTHCGRRKADCLRVESMKRLEEMDRLDKVYDFIVVGGGVAGVVVARRLAENTNYKVLLLEAGPEEPETAFIPAFAFKASHNEHYDWKYKTTPQGNACRANRGVCLWPRGKMLCGTACLSGLMYTRGHRNIYDKWSEENDGWSYDEVLEYFKKSETNVEPQDLIEKEYHGFNGPLHIGRYSHFPRMGHYILEAAKELQFNVADVNGYNQTVFTIAPIMLKDGIFSSPRRQFLNPVLGRKNLKVLVEAHVTRVLFDFFGTRATGVQFLDKWNRTRTVWALKEIILSAGVVGSPQILLLSGVGPREDLWRLGIRVVRNLRVGYNLHHHVGFTFSVHLEQDVTDEILKESMLHYRHNLTGPLASTGLTQITGFMSSKFADEGVPDIQIYLDSDRDRMCRNGSSTRNELNFRPIYLLTKCRGTIKLRSRNPLDKPLIDPNYLCNEEEVEALVDAEMIVRRLTETRALGPMVKQYNCRGLDKCNLYKGRNKDERRYWKCVIKEYTNGENHHAGTCKMGPAHDPLAVVDNKLRVHGIENLRVADASIMPTPINCNTIAPVIMIAEKAADMIKERWMWEWRRT